MPLFLSLRFPEEEEQVEVSRDPGSKMIKCRVKRNPKVAEGVTEEKVTADGVTEEKVEEIEVEKHNHKA